MRSPYGGTRYDAGSQMTLYRYTGQRVETAGRCQSRSFRGVVPLRTLVLCIKWDAPSSSVPILTHGWKHNLTLTPP